MEAAMAKVLIVLTSHTRLGDTGRATGFYFDEMAAPYYALIDAGHQVEIASIMGGAAVHDPGSVKSDPAARPAAVRRFLEDPAAMNKLSSTASIDTVKAADYDAVFLPGGHGTMYDFPLSDALARVVGAIADQGGVIGAVCHGPAGLVNARHSDGTPVVAGLRVNAFTDAEEAAVNLTDAMPFLLETRLRELGGLFEGAPNFTAKAVRDGQLVTGQNPMSADAVAALLVEALGERRQMAAE
jgi:putative intracellular protease/amidase